MQIQCCPSDKRNSCPVITQLTWSTAHNLLSWDIIPLQPTLRHGVPTHNHSNQVVGKEWDSLQMLSRCLDYVTGRSTGRKNSEFWSKNLNYMKYKHFGSLSCLYINNSIKQISSAGSVQFSCYSGTRCRKNALKCMLKHNHGSCTKFECIFTNQLISSLSVLHTFLLQIRAWFKILWRKCEESPLSWRIKDWCLHV